MEHKDIEVGKLYELKVHMDWSGTFLVIVDGFGYTASFPIEDTKRAIGMAVEKIPYHMIPGECIIKVLYQDECISMLPGEIYRKVG